MLTIDSDTTTGDLFTAPRAVTPTLPASPAVHYLFLRLDFTFVALANRVLSISVVNPSIDRYYTEFEVTIDNTGGDALDIHEVSIGPLAVTVANGMTVQAQSNASGDTDASTSMTVVTLSADSEYYNAWRAAEGSPTVDSPIQRLKAIDILTEVNGGGDLTAIAADAARLTAVRAAVLTDLIDGGRLDLLIDAIKSKTDSLKDSWNDPTANDCKADVSALATTTQLNARTLVAADYFDPAADAVASVTTVDTVTGGATSANQTTILGRLGTWTGSGVNTILGAFKALLDKAASAPSDIGGTFAPATDSVEAIRDRGDSAWATATGFSTHDAAAVVTAVLAGDWSGVTIGTVTDVTNAVALTAAERNATADAILVRGASNIENTADRHSLGAMIMVGTNSSIAGTTLTAKKPSDDSTFATYTVTVDASADPITGVE